MMKWMTCLTLLLVSSVATAGQMKPAQVPAGAKWLVHVDIDAAKNTTMAKECEKACSPEKKQAMVDRAVKELGIDPTTDLHGITIYGTTLNEGEGVALLNAKFSEEKVAAKMEKSKTYSKSEYGGKTVHSVTLKHHNHEHVLHVCFAAEDLVVVASPEAQLKSALDLLAGKGESLNGSDSPLLLDTKKGTVIQIAITGFEGAKFENKLPPVLQGDFMSVQMGEADGTAFSHTVIETPDEETGTQLKEAAEGLKAMAQLRFGKDKDLSKLIGAFKVSADGNKVTMTWEGSAEEVLAQAKKMHEMRGKWRKKDGKDKPKKDKPKKDKGEKKDKPKKDKPKKDDGVKKDQPKKDKTPKEEPKLETKPE